MRELRRAKLERQRRMAEAAQEPVRSAQERPRETVHAAAPSRPRPQQAQQARPQQSRPQQPQQQRPAQGSAQPDEAKRLAQEKARRDYFEEFFKNKQD
jgi:cell envelope opacity-associated protein A